MPEGFAGFQTQLSETFNKNRSQNDSLLEAFLDGNGRLAFRFVDESGNVTAQPRVTTPGFVRPSLGITPSTTPTTPSISNGVASPTASANLITNFGDGSEAGFGSTGGLASNEVGFSARPAGPPSGITENIGLAVSALPGPLGLGFSLATQLQRRRASVVPIGTQTLRQAMRSEAEMNAEARAGITPGPGTEAGTLTDPGVAGVTGNTESTNSLDSMTGLGTEAGSLSDPGVAGVTGSGEPGGGSAGGGEAGAGPGTGPGGGEPGGVGPPGGEGPGGGPGASEGPGPGAPGPGEF